MKILSIPTIFLYKIYIFNKNVMIQAKNANYLIANCIVFNYKEKILTIYKKEFFIQIKVQIKMV